MGLKDRVRGGLRHVWSPITVWMADQGSDDVVRAGETAKVCVDVRGEDDGTAERVDVTLVCQTDGSTEKLTWVLGQVPPTIGLHELEVTVPVELPPSCARHAEYSYNAELHRSKGTGSNAGMVVDVVARPQDVFWPDGARSGQDGEADAHITIDTDQDTVDAGTALTGRVTIVAARNWPAGEADLTLSVTVTSRAAPEGKTQKSSTTGLAVTALAEGERVQLPFSVDVPAGIPPTLQAGSSTIVWQVRVQAGGASGWRTVTVLDPQAAAGTRNSPSPSLLDFLDTFT